MKEPPTNQPTYATDINIVKEIKGDVKNPIWGSDFFCILLWSTDWNFQL